MAKCTKKFGYELAEELAMETVQTCQNCLKPVDLPNSGQCIRGHYICQLCSPRLEDFTCYGCRLEDWIKIRLTPCTITPPGFEKAWHSKAFLRFRHQALQTFAYTVFRHGVLHPNAWIKDNELTSNLISHFKFIENMFYFSSESRVSYRLSKLKYVLAVQGSRTPRPRHRWV